MSMEQTGSIGINMVGYSSSPTAPYKQVTFTHKNLRP
jgi:hypothetical protein